MTTYEEIYYCRACRYDSGHEVEEDSDTGEIVSCVCNDCGEER